MAIVEKVRVDMLKRLSTTKVQNTESKWLKHLEQEASPTILSHLRIMTHTIGEVPPPEQLPVLDDFVPVFNEPCSIVESGS